MASFGIDKLFRRERDPLIERVISVLGPVQDYAASHGGRIEVVSVTESLEITIRLRGACAHCPLSPITIEKGVVAALKEAIPTYTSITVLR